MKYFLLRYDRLHGRLIEEPEEYDDHREALRARFEVERTHVGDHIEVVVIGGSDVHSLRSTHSRYFEPRELV